MLGRPSRPASGRRVLVTEKLIRSLCAAPFGAALFVWGLVGMAPFMGGVHWVATFSLSTT